MKVKINHTLFITLSLITLLIAGNYWGIAQFVLPYKARLYILVFLERYLYYYRCIIRKEVFIYLGCFVFSLCFLEIKNF